MTNSEKAHEPPEFSEEVEVEEFESKEEGFGWLITQINEYLDGASREEAIALRDYVLGLVGNVGE